jgi:hypothetical protein
MTQSVSVSAFDSYLQDPEATVKIILISQVQSSSCATQPFVPCVLSAFYSDRGLVGLSQRHLLQSNSPGIRYLSEFGIDDKG